MPERVPWSSLAFLTVAALALLGMGAALGLFYCEYRRVTEVQQLSQVTKSVMVFATECMATLRPTVGAAIVTARTQPGSIMLATPARDSLRERRWTTP